VTDLYGTEIGYKNFMLDARPMIFIKGEYYYKNCFANVSFYSAGESEYDGL